MANKTQVSTTQKLRDSVVDEYDNVMIRDADIDLNVNLAYQLPAGGNNIGAVVITDSAGNKLTSQASGADAVSNANRSLNTQPQLMLYNGTTWDRMRGKYSGTLLASASRTVAQSAIGDQTNYNMNGVIVFLDITVASGTGGLGVRFYFKDPVSGKKYYPLPTATNQTAVGTFAYIINPNATGTQNAVQYGAIPLPRTWGVDVTVGDATAYTYSLGYAYV